MTPNRLLRIGFLVASAALLSVPAWSPPTLAAPVSDGFRIGRLKYDGGGDREQLADERGRVGEQRADADHEHQRAALDAGGDAHLAEHAEAADHRVELRRQRRGHAGEPGRAVHRAAAPEPERPGGT